MAVIKCKMCGGDLVLQPGSTVAECEYCGTVQTVPTADNEKKMTLFQRANRLRFGCEFDKAAGVYEAIVAEFPEESEAYWGLVLCKYGIEYVDDPATCKKIPTCHRSSFDSVMDDPNLDMALENADAVARRVYRDEAKAIEELRKGIVEVSSKEAPYDIFICYKETDEHGGRTLDSVLAQDVYDALVEKGYRVFFSRITLEDKLGQAYEPYIFAALHSAKIMLAFGTDYEYFNAVWVKNEWSRFLSLIASGEKKTLIPCYKGIDAYDMPKEFAKLQAQDMGKVGAIQDLLRGIDKVMGKTASVVVKETVVIQSEGGINTSALLKRGNLALEDRQYQKADEFFDRVLDIDAECAEAYFGKYLAEKRYRNMDMFKEKESSPSIECKTVCPIDIMDALETCEAQYQIPGYLSREDIGTAFEYDDFIENNDYYCIQKLDAVENAVQWNRRLRKENRLLAKANSFAKGDFAEILQETQHQIEASLNQMIANAKAEDPVVLKNTIAATRSHIEEGQRRVLQLYEETLKKKRENEYQASCEAMKNASSAHTYQTLMDEFSRYGDYKDSQKRASQCREKVEELKAEERRQAEAREKAQAAAKAKKLKRNIILSITTVVVVVVMAVAAWYTTQVVIPEKNYKAADTLFQEGRYDEALEAFTALEQYKDAEARCAEVRLYQGYLQAEAILENGDKFQAADAFQKLGDFKDAQERYGEIWYSHAEELLKAGDNTRAAMAFGRAGSYEDSRERSFALWDNIAVRKTLDTKWEHTVSLNKDGTVNAVGNNEDGQCNVSGWNNIVAVSAGSSKTVGLKADGTVVTTDDDDLSSWTDVVSISARYGVIGLKSDGTVVATSDDVSDWSDIVEVCAGSLYALGLKADGTVVATSDSFGEHNPNKGQCDVSGWKNIVAIAAGNNHSVGLRADGTVVATGYNFDGQCNVSDWTDIVAIAAGHNHTIGLKSDGTVVATGYNYRGQLGVSRWENITAIAGGFNHTVGLKADGTVVAVGSNEDGQCEIADWKNIKLPK